MLASHLPRAGRVAARGGLVCLLGGLLCGLLFTGCMPPSSEGLIQRGDEYAIKGNLPKAIEAYTAALEIDPKNAQTYFDRGLVYEQSRIWAQAVADYRQAISLDARHGYAHNSLAWILCTSPEESIRDGQKALEHARLSRQFESDWMFDDTLAAAHAELGQFEDAVKVQQMALDHAGEEDLSDEDLAEMRARMKLYQEKKPYRE